MSERIIPTILGKGWRFPGFGPLRTPWSFNSALEVTHWKRPWCWERLKARWEGDDRGWDGWMASPTQWTWVWVNSGSWWWTGRLQSMGCCSPWGCRVGHDWATDWTELELSGHLWVCHFTCWLSIKVQSCLPSWSHLILMGLCCVLGLSHSFTSCTLPLALLLHSVMT